MVTTPLQNARPEHADTPAESIELEAENRRLRAELPQAKRANDILKKTSAFRGGVRAPTEIVVRFIDDNRTQFGVDPIIRALCSTSSKITLSTYYAPQIPA